MTIPLRSALAALLALVPGLAAAQGFSGAEISAELLAFGDGLDLGEKEYRGALEFEVWGGFGAAADLSYHNSSGIGLGGHNATLHGFYDRLGLATVGGYIARDTKDESDIGLYGVEAATELMGGSVQGALGGYGGDDGEGAMLSVAGRYGFGNFAATGFAGGVSGDVEGSRLALGGEYQLGMGPTLYAELGRRSEDDDPKTYVAVGARLAIGPKAGTTFDSRSLFEILPGR
ncbi:hypothetical protein [Rubellimicrobium aerolatum]|uniref:Porin family protein n=1 Tax=Rubellimicrobium aerolatum TaxID=490979 RepID=A0ABW0S8D6_9RHOB|nr:hypothetical protein [Rubellimicrobium aerolatum]MBP1804270.1 hypothetical protein [Rubellimicrobium aerolatum]